MWVIPQYMSPCRCPETGAETDRCPQSSSINLRRGLWQNATGPGDGTWKPIGLNAALPSRVVRCRRDVPDVAIHLMMDVYKNR